MRSLAADLGFWFRFTYREKGNIVEGLYTDYIIIYPHFRPRFHVVLPETIFIQAYSRDRLRNQDLGCWVPCSGLKTLLPSC